MGLGKYVLKRLLLAIPMTLVLLSVVFFVLRVLPGDPVTAWTGIKVLPEVRARLLHEFGLDKPLYIQYFEYMINLFKGDMGHSYSTGRSVITEISLRFPATLELTVAGMIVAILIGLLSGVTSAIKRDSATDHGLRVFSLFTYAMPVFWLGLMLQLVFSVNLRILPVAFRIDIGTSPTTITGLYILDSIITGNTRALVSSATHLILPALTLGLYASTAITRISRANMIGVLDQDYITTARLKGLAERRVIYKHALPNVFLPIITVVGMQFALLMGGAILTESIFSIYGMGRLLLTGLYERDFPIVQGCAAIYAIVIALSSLVVDVMYYLLDPRIRHES